MTDTSDTTSEPSPPPLDRVVAAAEARGIYSGFMRGIATACGIGALVSVGVSLLQCGDERIAHSYPHVAVFCDGPGICLVWCTQLSPTEKSETSWREGAWHIQQGPRYIDLPFDSREVSCHTETWSLVED